MFLYGGQEEVPDCWLLWVCRTLGPPWHPQTEALNAVTATDLEGSGLPQSG